jgi:hypothetical protein
LPPALRITATTFTGDHDIYDIRYPDGRPLDPKHHDEIIGERWATGRLMVLVLGNERLGARG